MDKLAFLKVLKYDPRPKLFGYLAPGPVRARALSRLEDRPITDFLYQHSLKDCPKYLPRKRLLDDWKENGLWGVDRLYMRNYGEVAANDRALVMATKKLHLLESYSWTIDQNRDLIQNTTSAMLERTHADGFLGFISSKSSWANNKPLSFLRSDHWGGFAVAVLQRFGISDIRIDQFVNWLLENQRSDGGWLPEYFASHPGSESEILPSHPLHTTTFAFALSAHSSDPAAIGLEKALSFLLRNVFEDSPGYRRASQARWKRLVDPDFGQSALNVLQLSALAGKNYQDEALQKPFEWLIAQQKKDGRWPLSTQKNKHPDAELFLTLKVAEVTKTLVEHLEKRPESKDSSS